MRAPGRVVRPFERADVSGIENRDTGPASLWEAGLFCIYLLCLSPPSLRGNQSPVSACLYNLAACLAH